MAQVPSNLIPISITNLPVPVTLPSEDTLLVGVYQGVTYKIRAGDLLQVAGVPTSRQVIAGTGLTGGGALSSNVTLSVAPGGIGTTQLAASGVTPGVYGDGSNVPQVTVDATGRVTAATTVPLSISGYVPTSREVIAGNGLTGGGPLSSNVTLAVSYGGTPLTGTGSGSAGTALTLSRSDHRHPAVDLADQTQIDGILPIDQGGTSRSLVMQPGAVIWSGADGLYVGTAGTLGQVLVSGGSGAPTWGSTLIVAPVPANQFFGGPASGPNADPTFRALVNDDLPVVSIAKGGTGQTTRQAAMNTLAGAVTTAQFLRGDGTNVVMSAIQVSDVPVLNQNTTGQAGSVANAITFNTTGGASPGQTYNGSATATISYNTVGAPKADGTDATGTWNIGISGNAASATNLAGGAANRIAYQTGSGATGFITAPTVTDTFLRWNGTAFDWSTNPLGTVTSVGTGTGLTGGPITTTGTISFSVPAVGTWAATPSSANLAAAMTDETGSGKLVFADGATMSALTIDNANPYIQFNNGAAVTLAAGRMWYNGSTGSLNFGMGNGNITQQVGEELFVYGKASATISDSPLKIVYQTGTVGASGEITFAPTVAGLTDGNLILGIATEPIANNGFGRITTYGLVRGITTNGSAYGETWADGDVIWYNPTTGNPTKVKPSAPGIKVQLGIITHAGSGGSGSFFVLVNPGSVLGGTDSNVQFNTLATNNLIQYNGTFWTNIAPGSVTGVGSVANALTAGAFLTSTGTFDGSAARTFAVDATSANTASKVVARDASGNFSAGTITASLSGNATSATNLAGGAASQIPYQTGAGATGFIANGTAGQVLTSAGAGTPVWSGISGGTF
jgi:hypothetical protein